MDTPSSPAPLTPIGPRTPHAHPALYAVIAVLSLVIIAGALWVFWPRSAVAPAPSPSATPTGVETGGESVVYTNEEYGLRVSLPDSWDGYGVTTFTWTAVRFAANGTEEQAAQGPLIHIVNPLVGRGNPYQDIPIMVFTHEQWRHLDGPGADWSVSAAPIGPSVLASNSAYVFALPARYNFASPPGWEEVEDLIRNGAVSTFEP